MSKLFGIDYGRSKVGLALADSETKTAVPLETVAFDDLLPRIWQLISSEEITVVVVGWPLSMKGGETEQTREVKIFVADLKLKTGVKVVTEDERLSTVQAERLGKDDAVAAMYILQSYLDRHYG